MNNLSFSCRDSNIKQNDQKRETKTSSTLFNRNILKQSLVISSKYNELISKYDADNCKKLQNSCPFSILQPLSLIRFGKTTKNHLILGNCMKTLKINVKIESYFQKDIYIYIYIYT